MPHLYRSILLLYLYPSLSLAKEFITYTYAYTDWVARDSMLNTTKWYESITNLLLPLINYCEIITFLSIYFNYLLSVPGY